MAVDHIETAGEEIANAITHGIGALLSVSGLVLLVVWASLTGSAIKIVSASVFGAMLIVMYMASTIYHAFSHTAKKDILQTLDHTSIYLLIAGSYTPFMLVDLHGPWGWSLFGVIWALAVIGVCGKLFYRNKGEILSTAIYIFMGWLIVIAIVPMLHYMPWDGLLYLIMGGFCYTFGVVFFFLEDLPYNHMVWHLFVMAGSVCHFFAVFKYVIPFKMS